MSDLGGTVKPTMEELDCWEESEAVCPWCGHRNQDSFLDYREGYQDVRCSACGEPFAVCMETVVYFTTTPPGGWEQYEDE